MKNATRYCAGPVYYRMCSTDVYCSKQTGSSSTKGNHHPSFLRFWNWAEENCRCSQNLWWRRNEERTETQQTFVNGLLGFITLGIYTGSACVLLTIIAWAAPSIWATSYLHCSAIYRVPSSCFCIVISSLSEGEIIPFSGVCQSGGGCIIHAGGGAVTHWSTGCMQPTTTSATLSRRASFSALASANSSCILHRAAQHHADASACQ